MLCSSSTELDYAVFQIDSVDLTKTRLGSPNWNACFRKVNQLSYFQVYVMLPRRSIRLFARLFAFGAVVVFVLFLISHKNHTKALDDGIAWVKDVTVIRNIMNRNGDFWEVWWSWLLKDSIK